MKMTSTKAVAVGAALGVGLLVVLAAVPSQTDFDPAYFRTNALPITIVGNLADWQKLTTNSDSISSKWTRFPQFITPTQSTNLFNIYTNGTMEIGNQFPAFSNQHVFINIAHIFPPSVSAGASVWVLYPFIASDPSDTNNIVAIRSVDSVAEHDGIGTVQALYAMDGDAENYSTNIVTRAQGVRGLAANNVAGTILELAGLTSEDSNFGKVGEHYGLEVKPYANSGTTTNHYGVMVRAPSNTGTIQNSFAFMSEVNGGIAKIGDGLSSFATDSIVAFTATGITNSLGKQAVARFDGTTITYVVKNNAGTPQYTNQVAVGHATEILQAGGAIVITGGTGVSGTLAPF